MAIKLQTRKVVASDSVVAADLDGESVLLNVETGIYYGLDEVGTRIWGLLSHGMSPEDIAQRLLAEYSVEPNQLRDDLERFLDHLEREGLARTEED